MQLSLLVLRARSPLPVVKFYEQLGCMFALERHGKGPEHYACSSNDAVLEIYPCEDAQTTTSAVRLGFRVADLDAACKRAIACNGKLLSAPKNSPWGRRAVLQDPEGHTVELTEAASI